MRLNNKSNLSKINTRLIITWVAILPIVFHSNIFAQNPDTRKGWDLRGQGYDTVMSFVVRYSPQLQVLVGVATNDKMFIDEIKSIIRKLDKQDYEDIGLIIHDQYPQNLQSGLTHSLFFYVNTYPISGIVKENGVWYFVSMQGDKAKDVINLGNEKNKYPVTLINTELKMILKK